MLHDVFRKGWWTFKIKVRLICLIYFKETSKGAVMVALQAHAVISNCSNNSVGYGIRCIQNSRVRFIHDSMITDSSSEEKSSDE
jgi:hypothetical protein